MTGEAPVGPRILAIMGSGETAPTMAKVHRALFGRLGDGPVPAAILDTPYGFQENADELTTRTIEFFATSVGRPVSVASYRSIESSAVERATALARVRESRYLMAGPGSPSYALRVWADGPIPGALADGLRSGGILTMASAAALTLGVVTIPVYEIYKVGADPHWLEGLGLLEGATGLRAAVVPHYDNAEGGSHDTRFCYMGERRLRTLERDLPAGTFILGVDGHTALILDLGTGRATVAGLGGVTVRAEGHGTVFPSGSDVPIETLAHVAEDLAAGRTVDIGWEPASERRAAGSTRRPTPRGASAAVAAPDAADQEASSELPGTRRPIRDEMARLEGVFIEALAHDDHRAAVAALLELDDAIAARIRAGEDSPDLDNADATFRALIARLGEHTGGPAGDPRQTIAPLIDALVEVRSKARDAGDWAAADAIRDRLLAVGIELHDGPDGTIWSSGDPP